MAAFDPYRTNAFGLNHPGVAAVAVTPSDTEDLEILTRGLWVGGGGDVTVILAVGSEPVTFVGVAAGTLLPLRVSRVLAAGTDASGLVGVW